MVVKDESKPHLHDVSFDKLSGSQVHCRKLMVESLALIEQFHSYGIRVRTPLEEFVGVRVSDGI